MADNLDLRTSTDRATVNFDCGSFKIRHPRELVFAEMGKLIGLGKKLDAMAGDIDDPKILTQCEKTMQALTKIVLVEIPQKALVTLTPDDMQSLLAFFNALRTKSDEPDLSESVSSSSPGVNDSTEAEAKD
ncbi:hypothetical protein LCGC14_2423930 [marine sediment metagenome]|uniref:Phage tail assembly protein n=2 Tax=root TaxID=1 RepID=A0A9C9NHB1_9HYPH|nr:hypothetical protein [Aurantimonas coralicida]